MAKQKVEKASADAGLLQDGNVVIQFSELIRHFVFTPEQAISFGTGLIKLGAHGESVQRVSPPGKTSDGPRRVQ
jgi:hypothetical protein